MIELIVYEDYGGLRNKRTVVIDPASVESIETWQSSDNYRLMRVTTRSGAKHQVCRSEAFIRAVAAVEQEPTL